MIKFLIPILGVTLLSMACGSSEFRGTQTGGDAGVTKNSGDLNNNIEQSFQDSESIEGQSNNQLFAIDPETTFDNSPEGQTLKRCFLEWGQTPFDEASARNFRTLSASSTGFGSRVISDRTKTERASLVLVKIDVQGFSSVELDLGNPNGWYCISSTARGFTSLRFDKHCRATIGNLDSQMTGFGQSQNREYGDNC